LGVCCGVGGGVGCHRCGGHLAEPAGGYGESGEVVEDGIITKKVVIVRKK